MITGAWIRESKSNAFIAKDFDHDASEPAGVRVL